MKKIIYYVHHGFKVAVQAALKGRHKDHCLCFQGCARFYPGDFLKNCRLAQSLFEFDKRNGMVTPVWECPLFHRGKREEESHET